MSIKDKSTASKNGLNPSSEAVKSERITKRTEVSLTEVFQVDLTNSDHDKMSELERLLDYISFNSDC